MTTIGPAPQSAAPRPVKSSRQAELPPASTVIGAFRVALIALGYAGALFAAGYMLVGPSTGSGPRQVVMILPALLAVGLAPWFPRWSLVAILGAVGSALAGGMVLLMRGGTVLPWWTLICIALVLSVATGPRRRRDVVWSLSVAAAVVVMTALASSVVVQAITSAQGHPYFSTSVTDPSGARQSYELHDENGQPYTVTEPAVVERASTPLEALGERGADAALQLGSLLSVVLAGAFLVRLALTPRTDALSSAASSGSATNGEGSPGDGAVGLYAALATLGIFAFLLFQLFFGGGSGTAIIAATAALTAAAVSWWAWRRGALRRASVLAHWRRLASLVLGGIGVLTIVGSIGPLSYGAWLEGIGAELLVLGMVVATAALTLSPFFPRLAFWFGMGAASVWLTAGLLEPLRSASAAVWLFVLLSSAVLLFLPARRSWFGYAVALTIAGTAFYAPFIAATSSWSNRSYGGTQYGSFGGPAGLLFAAGQAFVTFVLPPLIAWAIRAGLRSQAERTQLKAAQRRLEDSRKELAESEEARALSDDRRAIAGDVHDVLAHSLTVIVAQGQGALVVDGAAREQAVRNMVEVARSSLLDVRALIERLDGEDSDRPSPGLEDLPPLVETFRQAGLAVELNTLGEPSALPGTTQLAVYRIVQEALTNALKHAERGARCLVSLDWRGDDPGLSLTVSSTGFAETAAEGTGMGLTGMRTRAAVAGGWLTAGRNEDANPGWLVTAHLPAPENHTEVLR